MNNSNSYTLFGQMKMVKDRVRLLLEKHPHLRDNDYKLYATFIAYEIGGVDNLKNVSGYTLLTDIADGKYTHFESVRRCRAKLQEQVPELRGEVYNKRKRGGEDTSKSIASL
jgi:hypothetical protein